MPLLIIHLRHALKKTFNENPSVILMASVWMLDVRLVLDISAIFTDILDKHSEISGTQ